MIVVVYVVYIFEWGIIAPSPTEFHHRRAEPQMKYGASQSLNWLLGESNLMRENAAFLLFHLDLCICLLCCLCLRDSEQNSAECRWLDWMMISTTIYLKPSFLLILNCYSFQGFNLNLQLLIFLLPIIDNFV